MRKNFVPQRDIDLAIDGLNKYFQRMLDTQSFNPLDMKNFMEPIFTEAGYRDPISHNSRGGGVGGILIVHDSGVGDLICTSPVLKEIRRLYPTAHITLVVFQRALDLAEPCPHVDEVIANPHTFDLDGMPDLFGWNLKFVSQKLLRRRYDIALAFVHYPCTLLLSYMSGAQTRISHQFNPGSGGGAVPFHIFMPLITDAVSNQFYGSHAVNRNLALVDHILKMPVVDRELEIRCTPLDRATAFDVLRDAGGNGNKLIALCFGGSSRRKQWPPENYARLVERIIEHEPDTKFVILGGGPTDKQSAAVFKQALEPGIVERVIDLVDRINYRQSAAVLELCNLYIGNDTSAMHMAAALKVSVLMPSQVAADLPDSAGGVLKNYYPYRVPSVIVQPKQALDECRGSTHYYGCRHSNSHCITLITVEKMFEGYELLKRRIADNNIEPLFVS